MAYIKKANSDVWLYFTGAWVRRATILGSDQLGVTQEEVGVCLSVSKLPVI